MPMVQEGRRHEKDPKIACGANVQLEPLFEP